MVNLNKKGISPVIATILLLAITVIIAVGVYQFLNTYTQDTFDNVSGDATVDLAFANKVTLYDSAGNITINIARTTYPENLNFTSFVFRNSEVSYECTPSAGEFEVVSGQSNPISLDNTDCPLQGNPGQYDMLMIGDTTVSVDAIEYR